MHDRLDKASERFEQAKKAYAAAQSEFIQAQREFNDAWRDHIHDPNEAAITKRRFGSRHKMPCNNPNVLTCAVWECQNANSCQRWPAVSNGTCGCGNTESASDG